jgi:hypothetical protein
MKRSPATRIFVVTNGNVVATTLPRVDNDPQSDGGNNVISNVLSTSSSAAMMNDAPTNASSSSSGGGVRSLSRQFVVDGAGRLFEYRRDEWLLISVPRGVNNVEFFDCTRSHGNCDANGKSLRLLSIMVVVFSAYAMTVDGAVWRWPRASSASTTNNNNNSSNNGVLSQGLHALPRPV